MDSQRGRTSDDARRAKDKGGKPRSGKPYQRNFDVQRPKRRTAYRACVTHHEACRSGFDYSFNAQTAVDETTHIIVAAEVVSTSSNVHQLPMVLVAVKANTGEVPSQALADAGYRGKAVIAQLPPCQPQTELVIALGREGKVLAKPRDEIRYPPTTAMAMAMAMAAKFEAERGKADYRKRKWIAEPPNGWIRRVLGFRQFNMLGLKKANAEFKLVCLALNLRRMSSMQMG